jgi:predicted ATP-grasp superfamily ATP-dependent carboligase
VARVLLAVDESPASLAATRALRAGGHEPWLGLSRPDTPAARSRDAAGAVDLPSPLAAPERYALALAEAAAAAGAEAVLPATESALRALSGRESLFGGVAVGTCGVEALERATDKALLAEEAPRHGLHVPRTTVVAAGEVPADLEYPVVLKPLRSTLVRDDGTLVNVEVERADDRDELERLLARTPGGRAAVQQHVEGTLAAIGGVVWRGELVCASHQVSRRIWPPGRGITAYGETVPPDADRERAVASLLRWVGWSGIFQVQFLLDRERAWLIDLNPRIYGSLALAVAAGLNLPSIWVDLLLGREPRVGTARVGQRYRVEEDDVRALAAAFRAGRRSEALAGLLPRRHTAHAALSLRDPAPFLTTLAKAAQRVRSSPKLSRTS